MNYKLIDSEFDQMLRDAMADLPPPTDEELDAMLDEMWREEQERRQEQYWSGRTKVAI
jgi:hypothetical protein